MKPDLTGKGMGEIFFQAGIAFAAEELNSKMFRLSVATFNKRAIRLYKNIGFQVGPVFLSRGREFMLMEYKRPSV